MNSTNRFPPGWDEARVRGVLDHYEAQSEAEAIAEDEAAYTTDGRTMVEVPTDLVSEVRDFIARHRSG